ncbi:MAG: DUF4013 domain-containing protein [Candidatus Diapherotrites archaeon]|nr:DUF4013 domain-containing protein [Candidatus Diapherotrites archaeon]
MDYASAIKRPFEDKKNIFISFLISVVAIIVFPLWLLFLGYAAHAAKNALERKKELPKWNVAMFLDYLIKGILIILIKLIYTIAGVIVLAFSVGSAIVGVLNSGGDTTLLSQTILGAGFVGLIGVLLFVLGALLAPMAIMSYLKSNKFLDAFAVGKIFSKTFSSKFFVSLVVLLAYFFVLFNFVAIIALLTFGIGLLLYPLAFAYFLSVSGYEIFAETYNETP